MLGELDTTLTSVVVGVLLAVGMIGVIVVLLAGLVYAIRKGVLRWE